MLVFNNLGEAVLKGQPQGVEKVDTLPERAKKDKSKATGKPVIEAYMAYVD